VLLFLIGLFGVEFLALVLWCIQLLRPAKRNAVIRAEIDAKKKLGAKFMGLTKMPVFATAFDNYLMESEDWDRHHFDLILDKIITIAKEEEEPEKDQADVVEA